MCIRDRNKAECWTQGTATFMILGDICTRNCKFCAVNTGKPLSPDVDEPYKILEVVKLLNLKHVVLTSVDVYKRQVSASIVSGRVVAIVRYPLSSVRKYFT